MPVLENWNARYAVTKYLADLNRRQSNRTVESTKTNQNRWFKHIFELAHSSTDTNDNTDDNDFNDINDDNEDYNNMYPL